LIKSRRLLLVLRMSAIGLGDGPSRLVAAVAVDQGLKTESDGVRTGTRHSLPHEGVDISQKTLVYPRNELRHAFSIANCYAQVKGERLALPPRVPLLPSGGWGAAGDAGEAIKIGKRLV
jgi:hypothetical protein